MARMRFSRWDVVWLQNRPLIAGNVLHSWRRMRWKPIRNDRYPAGRLRMSAWPPRTNSPLRFPSPHLLLFSLQMKKQLEAFSPDRLLGYISKLMIYRTETDGKMEQEIDKCREVKRERGRTVIAQARLDLNSCKNRLWRRNTGGISTNITQLFQPLAHKSPNFFQFLWVIPLNWRTIGFDWTHALISPFP